MDGAAYVEFDQTQCFWVYWGEITIGELTIPSEMMS